MKKNYFLLFFLFGLLLLKAQIVNIPDPVFKQYLTTYYDLNGDKEIQESEALKVTSLSFPGKDISSIEGIRFFRNIQNLYCVNNKITSLDLQGLSNLTTLDCSSNKLTFLKLTGLSSLTNLNCNYNNLTAIDFSGLNDLQFVECSQNQLTYINLRGFTKLLRVEIGANPLSFLDLQNCTSLGYIGLFDTGLKELDLSNLVNLQQVSISGNPLTLLNFQGCTKLQNIYLTGANLPSLNLQGLTNLVGFSGHNNHLESLNLLGCSSLLSVSCGNNQLTSLDLKDCINLQSLTCSDNNLSILSLKGLSKLSSFSCENNVLSTLNIEDCIELQDLSLANNKLQTLFLKNGKKNNTYLGGNPDLKFICCDQLEVADFQQELVVFNLQNQCLVNSYCSFTPGGNYNTIQGNVKLDQDSNGCDSSDFPFFPIKFLLTSNSSPEILIGNNDGSYKYYVNTGTYTLTPAFENPDYFIASPPSRQFVFSNSNSNTQNQDFCISANGTKNDLEVKIIPVNTVRPGFNTTFRLIYKNKGNTVQNGDVSFTFDHLKSELVSADISPNSSTAGNLSWTFNQLKPFESKTIIITLKTFAPPTVNVSEKLTYTSKLNPVSGDLTEYDNSFSLVQTVVGSFDPNDKVCLEGDVITPNLIGKYVTYKIRFENTGTANAEQVVVKDIINTAMFDVNSIIPIVASHSYKTRITGNVVEFIFENIDLPFDDANNDGYIVFKIKTLPNLIIGSQIKNKAEIYFDYNLPITTNEFVSSFQTLGTGDLELPKEDLKIYPNPVKDFINIESREKIVSIEIFDLNGRILSKSSPTSNKVDVKTLKSAIYIIKANTKSGYYLRKIIKE